MTAPALSMLTESEDWLTRLRSRLPPVPDPRLERSRVGTRFAPDWARVPSVSTTAAVLVPILLFPDSPPRLLLTVRASHLRSHAGQVSFPGGRIEPRDPDAGSAALRETFEEVGIHPGFVEPIGFLCDQIIRTGYRITPLVGLLRPGFTVIADSTEVAEVFEMPLAHALCADNYRVRDGKARGVEFETWELPYGDYQIWGATAGILANLREVLCGDEVCGDEA
jgi:8-oxo-dGTP pyrophosphatase MutT (NUDIX family)